MWLLTEITFLYKSGHQCLSVEQCLLPKFKTSLGLNIFISEYECSIWSSAQIKFECLQHCCSVCVYIDLLSVYLCVVHRSSISLAVCCRWTTILLVSYVVCYAEKMCHLLSAACQYASYFVRWTTNTHGFFYLVCHTVKMCHRLSVFYQYASYVSYELPFLLFSYVVHYAEKMYHLLSAACQYASYFVRWTTDPISGYLAIYLCKVDWLLLTTTCMYI